MRAGADEIQTLHILAPVVGTEIRGLREPRLDAERVAEMRIEGRLEIERRELLQHLDVGAEILEPEILLEEGQQLAIDGAPWLLDKETQPPARLSEAKLVQLMDEQGLGTKATRPDIIQKLYSRKYVRNHPPEPTATGMAMYLSLIHISEPTRPY